MQQLLIYSNSHELDGRPYIGEYHDEITGAWLIAGTNSERSRYYNHSTFGDLVIYGLVGLVPRPDNTIEIDPLLPADSDSWPWFCLDGIPYHGHSLTIMWDKTGQRYGRGPGLALLIDGQEKKRVPTLEPMSVEFQ